MALSKALAVLTACTLPFALHEALTGRPIIIEMIEKLPGINSVEVITYEKRMGLERVQLSLAHPIHYGLFCSIVFSLTLVALRDVIGTTQRICLGMIVGICCFLSLSSGAILALLLQMGMMAWTIVFRRVRARWWILVGLFVLAYVVIDILSDRTPIRVFMNYATFSAHNAYWRGLIFDWGMVNVWGSPILGIGMNDWVRPEFMEPVSSIDNFWLLMAMRYGIPGFLLLVVGYGITILRIMARGLARDSRLIQIRRAWVFTFLGLSFTLCTVHVWTNLYSFVFFMFSAGIWLSFATPDPHDRSATNSRTQHRHSGPGYSRFAPHNRPAGSVTVDPA